MRASRLIALLMLLRTSDRWTADALADELEVSVRTIYRDVAALQSSGVPLWTESGPGGGIRVLPGWSNDLDGLTGDEAAALTLSGAPAALSDLGLGAVALSARLKVRSTLPPELRSRAARVEERFHLDAPGWFHEPEPVEHLAAISDAVWSGRRIDITYDRGRGPVRRRLDPLGLVLKAGTWYLVARHRGDVRTYRIGRVRSCAVREDSFTRPDGFDLATWWGTSSAEFDRSILRARCTLALSPRAQRRLVRVTDTEAARRALEDGRADDGRDGWVIVDLECESEEVIASQLVGIAEGVEVVDPPSLRRRLHETGRAIAELNRPTAPQGVSGARL